MMNMTIARMEEQHIEAVADLEAMCFSTPWTEENLRSSLANKTDYFFVALDVAFAFAKGVEQFVANFCRVHVLAERINQSLLYLPIAKLQFLCHSFIVIEESERNFFNNATSAKRIRKTWTIYTYPTSQALGRCLQNEIR